MRNLRRIALLSILSLTFCFACSDNSTPPQETTQIGFTPTSGPPGTVITITGVDLTTLDATSLSVTIGSESAPALVDESGHIITGVPLFLDGTGASLPPVDPVDLLLYDGDQILFSAAKAITVTPLVDAPGTTVTLAARMNEMSASLNDIVATLVPIPGVQEQYLGALSSALDSLLASDGGASFATNLAALQSDAASLRVVDAVLAHTGILDAMSEYATLFTSVANDLASKSQAKAATPVLETDVALAKQMQFYVILRDFGQDVVAESAAQIGVVAGLISIAVSNPYVSAVALITNYVDFIVNKIAIGLFPSELDAIELEVDPMLDNGAATSSTITLTASNSPPGISIIDLTNQVLVGLGLAASPSEASFRTILENTSQYFLGLMSSTIQAYSQLHPELNLDPTLFALVPQISWSAVAEEPVLFKCESYTPSLITGIEGYLQWKASETNTGRGRIYVKPSLDPDAHYFSSVLGYEYNGGAFGESTTQSSTVSVFVGEALAVEIDFPSTIEVGAEESLDIRAGYRQGDGTVDYTSGIEVSIQVSGGVASAVQGVTNSSGYFFSSVSPLSGAHQVLISVTAIGDEGIRGEANASAVVAGFCGPVSMPISLAYDGNLVWDITLNCIPMQQTTEFWCTYLNTYTAGSHLYIGTVNGATIHGITGTPQGYVGEVILEVTGWATFETFCPYNYTFKDTVSTYVLNP
ncbi:MAG TPA: hypothetical protein VKA63_01585 [Candidatus Krumholzibacteria bacterium]|nr:hypothetical protein [Candidatus Krumholzibacteria bacterium]